MNDQQNLKAIETRYAGCLFRSRLEARWAVFLDHFGIAWQYEAQGYECQPRCRLSGTTPFWYLPDFWLPDLGLFAEVKGQLTGQEVRRLLDAAAYLSSPQGGCGGGSDLVVLGSLPRPDAGFFQNTVPVLLHMHKGDLNAVPWIGQSSGGSCYGDTLADDENARAPGWDARRVIGLLLSGWQVSAADHVFRDAYQAARSARFEHGQSGAPGQGAR